MIPIAWAPSYRLPLPESHRFPMEKYNLIPQQLLREGIIKEEQLFCPAGLDFETAALAHDRAYLIDLVELKLPPAMVRRIGFPLTQELVDREFQIARGTLDCALFALETKLAFNVAGGTHHASASAGEGFCLLNDIAIAASYLLARQKADRVLVVDLDVHQGNGTASIFRCHSQVFTFSMHGQNNYPLKKEQSTLDIGLPDGTSDETFLQILNHHLSRILDQFAPQMVFYQAGVDVLQNDRLGRLALSMDGCKRRDELLFEHCYKRDLPVVVVMGGGYAHRLSDVVNAHCRTFEAGLRLR